jgi:hypothetical protein
MSITQSVWWQIPAKREKKFRKTLEKKEGFSFVTPVTGLKRPNTGKDDDDDDDDDDDVW